MKKIFIFLILQSFLLSIGTISFATPTATEALVIGTVKNLAKIYISTIDIEKMRKRGLEELNAITDKEFNKEYAKVFIYVDEIPKYYVKHYGITKNLTKQKTITLIKKLSKKDLTLMVKNTPDKIIIDLIYDYLDEEGIDHSDGLSLGIIQTSWTRITEKINREVNKK